MLGNDQRAPSFSAGRVRRRPERAADEGFRFDLFYGSRAPGEDLAALRAASRAADAAAVLRAKRKLPRKLSGRLLRDRRTRRRADRPDRHRAHAGCRALVDIALIMSWRRRGIGASLVNGVLDEARAADLQVRLSVFSNNAAALRFYLRLGFRPIASSAIGMRLEWRNPCHKEARTR